MSSGQGFLIVPETRTQTHVETTSCYCTPHLWNRLSENLSTAKNAEALKPNSKCTFLPWLLLEFILFLFFYFCSHLLPCSNYVLYFFFYPLFIIYCFFFNPVIYYFVNLFHIFYQAFPSLIALPQFLVFHVVGSVLVGVCMTILSFLG